MRISHKDIYSEWTNGTLLLSYGRLRKRFIFYSEREAKRLFIVEYKEKYL